MTWKPSDVCDVTQLVPESRVGIIF